MSLGDLIDKVASLHFAQMDYFAVRDIVKEISKISVEPVIQREIAKLSVGQVDVLMKIVYVALANDCPNSVVYFKWHAALYEVGGAGSIMRTLCDKEALQEGSPTMSPVTPSPPK